PTTEATATARAEALQRWLSAAGNLPLSISIASDITYQPSGQILYKVVVDMDPKPEEELHRSNLAGDASIIWRTIDDIFYYKEIEMSSVDPGLVTN
ncbi:hypothetical protein FA13DRAFT_1742673, partial [Coprinellus micaceus]